MAPLSSQREGLQGPRLSQAVTISVSKMCNSQLILSRYPQALATPCRVSGAVLMSYVGNAFANLRQHNYESEKPEHSRGIQVSLILNYASVAECKGVNLLRGLEGYLNSPHSAQDTSNLFRQPLCSLVCEQQ